MCARAREPFRRVVNGEMPVTKTNEYNAKSVYDKAQIRPISRWSVAVVLASAGLMIMNVGHIPVPFFIYVLGSLLPIRFLPNFYISWIVFASGVVVIFSRNVVLCRMAFVTLLISLWFDWLFSVRGYVTAWYDGGLCLWIFMLSTIIAPVVEIRRFLHVRR